MYYYYLGGVFEDEALEFEFSEHTFYDYMDDEEKELLTLYLIVYPSLEYYLYDALEFEFYDDKDTLEWALEILSLFEPYATFYTDETFETVVSLENIEPNSTVYVKFHGNLVEVYSPWDDPDDSPDYSILDSTMTFEDFVLLMEFFYDDDYVGIYLNYARTIELTEENYQDFIDAYLNDEYLPIYLGYPEWW